MQSSGGRRVFGVLIGLAVAIVMIALLVPSMLGSMNDPSVLVRSGSVVTPVDGQTVVYLDVESSQIHCTATTSDGQTLPLAPFIGAHREKRFGGKRRFPISNGKNYWAVGELPADRGPVTLRCPGMNRAMWVSAPPTWSWPLVVFMVISGSCLVLVVVTVVRRRRRGLSHKGGQHHLFSSQGRM
ncbi:MAG: hypothetical protein P4L86_17545 [Mycobacterium sp.]|nr:hypothetical protein [Mycobacterium sp.]